MPTGTVTWEGVITLWSQANVSFYNWTRDVQGRVADNRAALYRIESGVEVKVPYATLDKVRENNSALASMGATLNAVLVTPGGTSAIAELKSLVTNAGDSNSALTEIRGGVAATVSGLSGLTTSQLDSAGHPKIDDVLARLQRIEDKVDALASP